MAKYISNAYIRAYLLSKDISPYDLKSFVFEREMTDQEVSELKNEVSEILAQRSRTNGTQ